MKNYFIIGILICCFFSKSNAQCWSPLGTGINGIDNLIFTSTVNAMINYNGNLIAAGQFDSVGGIAANNIASWDGSNWSNLGTGTSSGVIVNGGIERIAALAVYNGELYATGLFDSAGGVPAQNIAKWNGTSWSAVGSDPIIPTWKGGGTSLAVYNGQLYAGWGSDTAGGSPINGIARWNDTSWSDVGGGLRLTGYPGGVWSLATGNGLLYVGGLFDSAGNEQGNNIAVWNDTAWSALGNGLVCTDGEGVQTVSFCNGRLYAVVEFFRGLNDYDTLYEWDGTVWNAMAEENIPVYMYGGINAFYNLNGRLIVGGSFSSIHGVSAYCLAQWDDTSWSDFGGGVGLFPNGPGGPNNFISSMCEFNGDLYVTGRFDYIDSQNVNYIARYTCGTTGIADIRNAENSTIYPNPVTDILYITNPLPNASYTVTDMTGRICALSEVNQVDVSALPAGVYCLREQDSDGSVVRKFVKE